MQWITEIASRDFIKQLAVLPGGLRIRKRRGYMPTAVAKATFGWILSTWDIL
jgi:hypothetical protein